jgi:hypothetical protein
MVAQPAGTTPRQSEGAPAARLARWALRAVITVTALGVALAACSNSSDPVGNVAAGPATGDATKNRGRRPQHRHDRGRCGRHRHLHRSASRPGCPWSG